MEYNIPVKRGLYHQAVLKILNTFLNMTDYEIEIVATMLKLNIQILDNQTRKLIRETTGKDLFTFNNYIKRLKDRNCLIKSKEGLILNENIRKNFQSNELTFRFDLQDDTEKSV